MNRTRRLRRVLIWWEDFQSRLAASARYAFSPALRWRERVRLLASPARAVVVGPPRLGSADRRDDSLVILTANLWHDWPRRRRLPERLEAFARVVEAEGAQVVLLQEVVRGADFRADEWLAKRLGMEYAYVRANGHEGALGFEEGVAVLSRFPLADAQHLYLTSSRVPFVNRVALGARLSTPCGEFWTFSTHLGIMKQLNAAQLEHLQAWIAATTGDLPAMIGGDFNTAETSPQMARLRQEWVDMYRHAHPNGDSATFEMRMPWGGSIWRARLDYLFLLPGATPWRITGVRHVQAAPRPYSDHQSVVARLSPEAACQKAEA